MTNALDRARATFGDRFGGRPEWTASAPGRVNLIGEHTDYNEGWVLPIALESRTAIAASRAAGAGAIVALEFNEETPWPAERPLTPGAGPRWADYVLGVVHEFERQGSTVPALDIVLASDVPPGAGLSSSAALEVAVAIALESITGITLEPIERIRLCRRAEHTFPGTPCGIMDMYIASEARRDHALLIDCRSETARPVPTWSPTTHALLVVDTGVRHALADGAYRDRARACAAAAEALGVPALRDIEDPAALVGLEPTLAARARHVVEENRRTLLAANALAAADVGAFGRAMYESHASLRDLFAVSCAELDCVVETAAACPGVLGARMTGGGFGGCAIVLIDAAAVARVRRDVNTTFRSVFGRSPRAFTTRAGAGARRHT